jgi:hypothetical protein
MLHFLCPNCQFPLHVLSANAGMEVCCLRCEELVRVPLESTAQALSLPEKTHRSPSVSRQAIPVWTAALVAFVMAVRRSWFRSIFVPDEAAGIWLLLTGLLLAGETKQLVPGMPDAVSWRMAFDGVTVIATVLVFVLFVLGAQMSAILWWRFIFALVVFIGLQVAVDLSFALRSAGNIAPRQPFESDAVIRLALAAIIYVGYLYYRFSRRSASALGA